MLNMAVHMFEDIGRLSMAAKHYKVSFVSANLLGYSLHFFACQACLCCYQERQSIHVHAVYITMLRVIS